MNNKPNVFEFFASGQTFYAVATYDAKTHTYSSKLTPRDQHRISSETRDGPRPWDVWYTSSLDSARVRARQLYGYSQICRARDNGSHARREDTE